MSLESMGFVQLWLSGSKPQYLKVDMNTLFGKTVLALCLGATGLALAQDMQTDNGTIPSKIKHRISPGLLSSDAPPTGSTGQATPPITFHGGPVIGGAPNIHLIWYGNWNQANGSDTPAAQTLVRDFMSGISGSNHLAINTGYTGSGSTQVSGVLAAPQEANVGYIKGVRAKRLRDSDITNIVSTYIASHGGAQTNATYFVLTSSDVNETSGFCTQYCGWHNSGTIAGATVRYSFVGNANRCLSSCAIQSVSPNNNPGVDGMISVLVHELEEALTDPDINAWKDSAGAENADKCAWTFGQNASALPNGSFYNVSLPAPSLSGANRNYLVQRNLKAQDSKCYVDGVLNTQ